MLILVSNMNVWLRRVRAGFLRLGGLFRKDRRDRELADEMAGHLEMQVAEYLRAGLPPQEARRQALLKLGGVESAKEIYRDRRSVPVLETLIQDVRYGLRMLGRNPGFTAVATITLALGIAANTTIFSAVSAVLVKKPPVPDPDRLMMVLTVNRAQPRANSFLPASVPDFIAWRDQNHAFAGMAGGASSDFTLTGGAEPERAGGLRVTSNYFQVLHVSALLGRTFLPEEDHPGHEHAVVLSYRLWQSRFHGDPNIVGRDVTINRERHTVVGVMPAAFRLNDMDAGLWAPLTFTPQQLGPAGRGRHLVYTFARLKPGVSVEQAQAEMTAIAKRIEAGYPFTNKNLTARVISLQEFAILDANVRPALVVLMGAVVFVLLIACLNIANLLLARNSARRRELVIRAAIGAGRFRLIRQLLTESTLLALTGGSLGVLFAVWSTNLMRARLNWNDYVQQMASEMVLDRPVLEFSLVLSLVAALVFGLLPALATSKLDLNAVLSEGARGGSTGIGRRRLRSALAVGEIALSIILLVGAGVLIQAVYTEMRQSVGFNPRPVLTVEVRLSDARYKEPEQQAAFFRKALDNAASIPGIESAAVTNGLPVTAAAGQVNFRLEGQAYASKEQEPKARHYVISPDYLQVMGIPLLKGRPLPRSSLPNGPSAVVVNETFARKYFPGGDPIGRRLAIDAGEPGAPGWSEIVGVAGDVEDWLGQAAPEPQIYESYLRRPQAGMTLAIRARSDPAALAPLLRQAVWAVDRDQPLSAIRTMPAVLDNAAAGDRLMSWLMGSFAAVALLLAAVGIFGVIAYNVAQRTREVGIRMALGAGRGQVLRLVVGQAAWLTALGVGLGLLGAFPLPNVLANAFVGLVITPGPVLAAVAALVAAVSLLASYIPARRATRVEPMLALRQE